MESAGIEAQPSVRVVASPKVYVRVWLGETAVAHYRSDLVAAHAYVTAMRGQLSGVRYTIDPLPSFAPPTRPLPTWQLEQVEVVVP